MVIYPFLFLPGKAAEAGSPGMPLLWEHRVGSAYFIHSVFIFVYSANYPSGKYIATG